MEQNRAILNQE